jgi:transcriptional regulator with XRE-family HTH domain
VRPTQHRAASLRLAAEERAKTGDEEMFLQLLGRRVRLLRRTAEMTQEELAALAGMSRSFISLIEHGTHGVDVVRILRLAAVLGVPATALFSTEPDERTWLTQLTQQQHRPFKEM